MSPVVGSAKPWLRTKIANTKPAGCPRRPLRSPRQRPPRQLSGWSNCMDWPSLRSGPGTRSRLGDAADAEIWTRSSSAHSYATNSPNPRNSNHESTLSRGVRQRRMAVPDGGPRWGSQMAVNDASSLQNLSGTSRSRIVDRKGASDHAPYMERCVSYMER